MFLKKMFGNFSVIKITVTTFRLIFQGDKLSIEEKCIFFVDNFSNFTNNVASYLTFASIVFVAR